MQDYVADEVTTRVILPEGSSDVGVRSSRIPLAQSDETSFSFLDTFVGRPTKVLKARDVMRSMLAYPIEVTYRFNPVFALLEPALLIGSFFAAFLALIALGRLDWTIAKDSKWHAARVRRPSPCFAVLYVCSWQIVPL